jgi:hypothetical protein
MNPKNQRRKAVRRRSVMARTDSQDEAMEDVDARVKPGHDEL